MLSSIRKKLEEHHIGTASEDGSNAPEETSGDESELDPSTLARSFRILLVNPTNAAVQVVSWPVPSRFASDYVLSPTRNSSSFHAVPPPRTTSTDPSFPLATFRGPKKLDPRSRHGWVFFDLVSTEPVRRAHFQIYIKAGRKGVEEAKLGRTDLNSTESNPMPSGEFGKVVVDAEARTVTVELDESMKGVQNVVEDSVKKGVKDLPGGKGVQTSTYVSYEMGRTTIVVGSEARFHEYLAPEHPDRISKMRESTHNLEGVGSRYVGAFVENGGEDWFNGHVKVDLVSGIAKGHGFNSTAETTAIFENGVTLNYGFHDAGVGRHDQVYVYCTPDRQSWLGDLIASNPAWLEIPFSKLALPAAHDSGMFGPLDAGLSALIQSGQLGNAIASHTETSIATPIVSFLVNALEKLKLSPERVIANVALTQKDPFPNQLHIGVRFFDFRPGFCFADVIHAKKGEIHHQHAMVPGCKYVEFLTNVLDFLAAHPSEIVMVENKSDGFVVKADKFHRDGTIAVYSMIPNEEELAVCMATAREATSVIGREIVVGGAMDLDKTIGALIAERKRLIIIDKVHYPDAWPRADSYDHPAYNTDDPAPIIVALEKTFAESSHPEPALPGHPLRGAIYQLQATPTSNIKDDVRASLTYSDSSSLLTFMKPRMDRATYAWMAGKKFEDPGNVVLLNDFVEGVLVEHAVEISRQRAGL